MKKTLLLALAAVATIFTSCSSDITNDNDDSNNGQGKGMTLIANVEQNDTRATLDTKETGTWTFAFTDDNDKVKVGNNTINDYYTFTFTKSGDTFSSTDAKVTSSAADWYAYYPATDIDLTNQEGTSKSAADLYALAGKTEKATTGAEGLTINMKAQAAVLRIVKVDNYGPCDIYLKTADGKFVKGLKAKKNDTGYDVVKSDTKVSVFYKANEGNAGIYYVIVPAGVKISVWNNDRCFKTTKDAGLTAGKYYTLTSGPTYGTATATINGETKTKGWVQLWYGGPRFATENVANEMTWFEAIKPGDEYVWGAKWHTASVDEVKSMYDENSMLNTEILKSTYEYKDKHGYTLTGKQPGYTNATTNTIFIIGNNTSNADYINGKFWLSDELAKGYGTTFDFYGDANNLVIHPFIKEPNYSKHPVRPVLTINTVLWGEQDIK
mgnify:CR=1 FL=1